MSRVRQLWQLAGSLRPEGFAGAVVVGWLFGVMVSTGLWIELVDPTYAEWQLRQWAGPIIITSSFILTAMGVSIYLAFRWMQLRDDMVYVAEQMILVELDDQ